MAMENGATALFAAAEKGKTEVVQLLLQAGADLNKATNNGIRPLHCASGEGHTDIVG